MCEGRHSRGSEVSSQQLLYSKNIARGLGTTKVVHGFSPKGIRDLQGFFHPSAKVGGSMHLVYLAEDEFTRTDKNKGDKILIQDLG